MVALRCETLEVCPAVTHPHLEIGDSLILRLFKVHCNQLRVLSAKNRQRRDFKRDFRISSVRHVFEQKHFAGGTRNHDAVCTRFLFLRRRLPRNGPVSVSRVMTSVPASACFLRAIYAVALAISVMACCFRFPESPFSLLLNAADNCANTRRRPIRRSVTLTHTLN